MARLCVGDESRCPHDNKTVCSRTHETELDTWPLNSRYLSRTTKRHSSIRQMRISFNSFVNVITLRLQVRTYSWRSHANAVIAKNSTTILMPALLVDYSTFILKNLIRTVFPRCTFLSMFFCFAVLARRSATLLPSTAHS